MEDKNRNTPETDTDAFGRDAFAESTSVTVRREENGSFFRRFFKIILTAIILTAVLIGEGAYVIDRKAKIEAKQSSFKLTDFDFAINSPSREQIAELSEEPSVNKIFPCYIFNVNVSGYNFFVLMGDSLDNYETSLFNEKTCISGKADPSGIMLDKYAAEKLNVKVGDTVSFVMKGNPVSLKVSGIYMTSTYSGLNKGLGLAVFTDEMKSYYGQTEDGDYDKAFVDAKDVAACDVLLQSYVPLGGNHISLNKIAVERKSVFMQDITDQIETRDSDITYVSAILGVASFIAYALLGILFVYMNKRDDEISLREGVPHSRMLKEYLLSNLIGALFVAVVTGAVLTVVAASKHYLAACLPIVMLSALPVLPAAAVVAVFTKIYLDKLYSVHIDRIR